ncbi:MAG TPA: YdiU family protein [Candidatus Limnocylindrales bacterium]|nr:YdiU family protein [Candidatus Limnocylindrales bacterium]
MTTASAIAPLFEHARFDNRFVRELPGDPESRNFRRQVHAACWSPAEPTPVAAPRLLAHAAEVAALLDLDEEAVHSEAFANVFGGNTLAEGMTAYAACYGGHQFGSWAGQLGDGRAIALGEYVNSRGQRWELQLKGAGPTPYSRTADGRAVLRSSIREFLCSEAMHHLGVPTTRALSLVATGESVVRDMLYDGHPRPEPGAIVCRVSPSFLRFGNFEILAARGDSALLERLVDFTIARDFPELSGDVHARRVDWFHAVCERTAVMVAHWMRVGFVHGVMNTDNMSILGLTIDYGPYGWIDNYDPDWTPNTTDAATHRYAFGRQPSVALWNLACLANALAAVFPSIDDLKAGLEVYKRVYMETSSAMTLAKFGLRSARPEDELLVDDAMKLLYDSEMDMTSFFRDLALVTPGMQSPSVDVLADAFYDEALRSKSAPAWSDWLARYAARVSSENADPDQRRSAMFAVNPRYVLRNYLAQQVIDRAEAGDPSGIGELLDVMRSPYVEKPGLEAFAAKRPDWARTKVGCSMLSCSS